MNLAIFKNIEVKINLNIPVYIFIHIQKYIR